MPRQFDSATDDVRTADGGTAGADANFAEMIMLRTTTDAGVVQRILLAWHSTNGERIDFTLDGTSQMKVWSGADANSTVTVQAADGWCIVGFSKATGTTTIRFHKYVISTGTFAHGDAAAAIAGFDVSSGSNWVFGNNTAGTSPLRGDIAWAAIFARTISDAEFEALCLGSLAQIVGSGPNRMWILDQDAVTQAVPDLSGNGANQTSRTGTAVTSASAPLLSYGADAVVAQLDTVVVATPTLRTVRSPLRW